MTFFVAGAIVGSAVIGAAGSSSAASTAAAASDKAAELQYQQYKDEVTRQKPFYDVGVGALQELATASRYDPFDMTKFTADPGYAFRLAEGQRGLDRSAAARGGMISGNALRAAARYGQDMGSQEYMNAFNRYRTQRDDQVNALRTLAGVGQTSIGSLNTAGANMATQAGQAIGAAGDARASGYMGMANAATGGLNSYLNYQNQQNQNAMMQQYLNQSSNSTPFGFNAGP